MSIEQMAHLVMEALKSASVDELRAVLGELHHASLVTKGLALQEQLLLQLLKQRLRDLSFSDSTEMTEGTHVSSSTPVALHMIAANALCTRTGLAAAANSDPGFVHLNHNQKQGQNGRNTDVYKLCAAAGHGCIRCIADLTEARVSINTKTRRGYTARDWASSYKQKDALEYIECLGGVASGKPTTGWH
jgi:hypothetical protein